MMSTHHWHIMIFKIWNYFFWIFDRWNSTFWNFLNLLTVGKTHLKWKLEKVLPRSAAEFFIISITIFHNFVSHVLKKWYRTAISTVFSGFWCVFIVLSQFCTLESIVSMYRDPDIHISYIRIENKSSKDVFNHRNKHIDSEMNMLDLTVEFSSFKYLTVEIWIFLWNFFAFNRLRSDVSKNLSYDTYLNLVKKLHQDES